MSRVYKIYFHREPLWQIFFPVIRLFHELHEMIQENAKPKWYVETKNSIL
jgi:hypothetical protein